MGRPGFNLLVRLGMGEGDPTDYPSAETINKIPIVAIQQPVFEKARDMAGIKLINVMGDGDIRQHAVFVDVFGVIGAESRDQFVERRFGAGALYFFGRRPDAAHVAAEHIIGAFEIALALKGVFRITFLAQIVSGGGKGEVNVAACRHHLHIFRSWRRQPGWCRPCGLRSPIRCRTS